MAKIAPSEGERRAVTGYHHQFQVAASIILHALRENELEWIRLADPLAGRVDDLQMGGFTRVDAFQIKWAQYGGNFSFNDLVGSTARSPALIAQLADGWKRLRQLHSQKRIVVHLLTNQHPSTTDRLSVTTKSSQPSHFAAFLQQVWLPFRLRSSAPPSTIPAEWDPSWQKLITASGLRAEEFALFVQDCELNFSYQAQEVDSVVPKEKEIVQKDQQELYHVLISKVADPARPVELSRKELLQLLGWQDRFDLKSRHEFPIDDSLYQPIETNVHQLEQALSTLPGGYIVILGSPGSGKSTFLTHTLRTRPERVIRYYAFVPESNYPVNIRGESTSFLHDVVLLLERAGFRVGSSIVGFDRNNLSARFLLQLQLLHDDWVNNKRKTLLLIDGLDHIEREQLPDRSLLKDLPPPDQIPDGVLILLGSQTDTILPDRIQAMVRTPDRRIQMNPLSRSAVFKVINAANLPLSLSTTQKETSYQISGGHPLALLLLLNQLQNVNDVPALESVLATTERFSGNIETQYHSYWKTIETDHELVHLVALLTRLRIVVDLTWVQTWAEPKVLDRLRTKFALYFRREGRNRWYFFHNSFRLFLVEKTAESPPGEFDPSRDRAYHQELAKICLRIPLAPPWSWEALFHSYKAGEHAEILKITSQEWFRSQFMHLRHPDSIQNDIRLAMRSSAVLNDPVAMARLGLSAGEIGQREYHLDEELLVSVILSHNNALVISSYLREGNKLLVKPTTALRASVKLSSMSLQEEAVKLFELCEPLHLLDGSDTGRSLTSVELRNTLTNWAEAALQFRSYDDVIRTIRRFGNLPATIEQSTAANERESLKNSMLFHVGMSLIIQNRWTEFAQLENEFQGNEDSASWRFWLHSHAWRFCYAQGNLDRAKRLIEQTVEKSQNKDLGEEARVRLAKGVFGILGDVERATAILKGIPQPNLHTDFSSSTEGIAPYLHRFRLNRMLYALGTSQSPDEIVPEPSDPRFTGVALLERALCEVARIWAEAWRGQQIDLGILRLRLPVLLRLFNKKWEETRDWLGWFVVQNAATEFYTLLIQATAKHGEEALEVLCEELDREWQNEDTRLYWTIGTRREILMELGAISGWTTWTAAHLKKLNEEICAIQETAERSKEYLKQSEAWIIEGNLQESQHMLETGLSLSLGVGVRKDYQLDTWIEWLGLVNGNQPERAVERIAWLSRAAVTLRESTEGKAARYGAGELLRVCFKWSPRNAVKLYQWFTSQGIILYEEGIRILLEEALIVKEPPVEMVLTCCEHLLLPYVRWPDRPFCRNLTNSILSRFSADQATGVIRRLVNSVETFALPSTRPTWRYEIAHELNGRKIELGKAGLTLDDLQDKSNEDSGTRHLLLKDGRTLTEEEIITACRTVDQLKELLSAETDGTFFDWSVVVEAMSKNMDKANVLATLGLFEGKRKQSQILGTLSERLSTLGDRNLGWDVAMKALDASESYGWSRWYDGGSRLVAAKALLRADPQKARPILFQRLAEDGGGGHNSLKDSLFLVAENLSVPQVWEEIEQYLHALFTGSRLDSVPMPILKDAYPKDTAKLAIAELVAMHVVHPISSIAQRAAYVCGAFMFNHDADMISAVRELLSGDEQAQEQALAVVDAVSLKNPDAIAGLKDDIVSFQSSHNWAIRTIAESLCERVGCNTISRNLVQKPLPATYNLMFPQVNELESEGIIAVKSGEPLPDTSDPLETVRPFDIQLQTVAKAADFPLVNLCHRAVQIMRELSPEEIWLAKGEIKLRNQLIDTGLRLPFRRPRSVLARRAMFHIVTELLDAGRLNEARLDTIESALRFYDPKLLLYLPGPRPSCVPSISGLDKYAQNAQDWVQATQLFENLIQTEDSGGNLVLAEKTELKRLDWGTPTESRFSSLTSRSISAFTTRYERPSFALSSTNQLAQKYPHLKSFQAPHLLILQHVSYGYDSPASDWIALNPEIARQLGWTPSAEGLFKWVNRDGESMVWSEWWVDSTFDQSPPHFYDEVGQGWLVVATDTAKKKIEELLGESKRQAVIARSFSRDNQEFYKVNSFERTK